MPDVYFVKSELYCLYSADTTTSAAILLDLGIILIVGSVIFALSWKSISERDQSALKNFQSRREGFSRNSKEKEKQVPKQFKNRRK